MRKRIYKDFDEVKFRESLAEAKQEGKFSEVLTSNNTNEAVETFTKAFRAVLDKHAPIKTVQNHENYVPFLSKELKQQMKYRDLLKKS